MKNSNRINSIMLGAAWLAVGSSARAATIQTFGPGSAVASVDVTATFDSTTVPRQTFK